MPAKQTLPGRGSKRKRAGEETAAIERSPCRSRPTVSPHQKNAGVLQPVKLGQTFLTCSNKPMHVTCTQCGMQYNTISTEDGGLHAQYCKSETSPIIWHPRRVQAAVGSRLITLNKKGKEKSRLQAYVAILPYAGADKVVQAKLQEIATRIDRALNASPAADEDRQVSIFYVMIKSHGPESFTMKQQVLGCAIVRPIRTAYRAIQTKSPRTSSEEHANDTLIRFGEDDCAIFCSPLPVPARVGVDRIWCEESYRRCGIAKALLDAIAAGAVYGAPIPKDRRRDFIAFSQPTQAGKRLFTHWTGTPEFLVFADS